METGRKILNLRLDRGLTQKELAKACGITPGALSKIESGMNRPSEEVLTKLAEVLETDPDYLLDETAPYPPPPPEGESSLQEEPTVQAKLSLRELHFLHSLRRLGGYWRDAAFEIPKASIETIRLVRFLLKREKAFSGGAPGKEPATGKKQASASTPPEQDSRNREGLER